MIRDLAKELANPSFGVASKRAQSPVKDPYIEFLDNCFDPGFSAGNYPANCRGSLARIDAPSLEFFVDIPALYQKVIETTGNAGLRRGLIGSQRRGMAEIRDIFVEAMKIIGEYDFRVEWNDQATTDNYDIDLNQLTKAYSVGNEKIRQKAMQRLRQWQSAGALDDFVILDAGVGIGGTIAPIIREIMAGSRTGEITLDSLRKIRLILFDTDAKKVSALKKALTEQFGFPAENIVEAPGEFYYMDTNHVLIPYLGRVSLVVSGAAISHTPDKAKAFQQIHKLLGSGGEMIAWDAFIPFLNSPYVKIGSKDSWERTVEISAQGNRRTFKLRQGQQMTEEMLQLQASGATVRVSTEISDRTASRYASDVVHMTTTLLGFNKDVIGEGLAREIRREAREYILSEMMSEPGFSFQAYLQWLTQHSSEHPVPPEHWPPFKILDSLENVAAYRSYCVQAGFSLDHFEYFEPSHAAGDTASVNNEPTAVGLWTARKH
ncbi:MAG: class I SAM-dependent methyltransferase [Candidatus Saganbacteria bacterium]|nr:class I SAM-dependent methyltransferase [Candidatus Saganbacteria bacterium]